LKHFIGGYGICRHQGAIIALVQRETIVVPGDNIMEKDLVAYSATKTTGIVVSAGHKMSAIVKNSSIF